MQQKPRNRETRALSPVEPHALSHAPERSCAVTREVMDERHLLRFVRSPTGHAVPDLKRKLPGRGVWVGLNRLKVTEAIKRGVFARGFGEQTLIEPGLEDRIGGLLRAQALAYVSLAKKAGFAVAGFDKIEEMLRRGEAAVLLHAAEAAADGVRRLNRRMAEDGLIVQYFLIAELDLALGRANVVHVGIKKGAIAQQLLLAVERDQMYEAREVTPVEERR